MTRIILFWVFLPFTSFAQQFLASADSVRKVRSIPAISYAVFNSDSIIESGAVGMRMYQHADRVNLQSRFQIGTNTTAFTCYIAAMMVNRKMITWNTPIIKVFPELNGKIMKLYNRITLLQLLSQRAGIPDYNEINSIHYKDFAALPGTPPEQRKIFVSMMLKRQPVVIIDSSIANYSMPGTAIAAAMLEKVSGKSWEELVKQFINKPLRINAGFGFPNVKDSTQPVGHWSTYGFFSAEWNTYWAQFFPSVAPAGNIQLSIPDYVKFVQDHLRGLNGKRSVLPPQLAQMLLFGYRDYAVGWKNIVWHGLHIAGWLGVAPVYSSYVEIIKEKDLGIIVLCNAGTSDGRAGVLNFGRMLRNYYSKTVIDR